MCRVLSIAMALCVLIADACAAADGSFVIQIDPVDRVRENTLVTLDLPESPRDRRRWSLRRLRDDVAIQVQQFSRKNRPCVAWMIQQPLLAGKSRQYRLAPLADDSTTANTVECRDDGRHLLVAVGDRPVLQYNHAVVESPEELAAHFRRSGYIHPLFDPAGRSVTDDFPPDHAHQHAVFFPWVNTTFDGRSIDFWNQAGGTAMVEHARFSERPISGPVFAQFVAQLRHSDITDPQHSIPVLDETWTVRVYNCNDFFLVDLESRQQCASDKPLTVNQHHYGGMAIRGSAQWFDSELAKTVSRLQKSKAKPSELAELSPPRDYLTSEGKTWIDGNATRARWVEMHGEIDGIHSGVTVMCHPDNLRAPQPVRLHPHKPYFCFAPMALGEFQIKPGETFVSKYRFYIHQSSPDAATSERLWRDYAHPTAARLVQGRPR